MRRRACILVVSASCMFAAGGVARATGPAAETAHPADAASPTAPAHPAAAVVHSQYDSEPIRRGGDGSTPGSSGLPHSQTMELPRVAGSLAVVIGLIFALRWGAKKFFVHGTAGKSTRAVQVLARSSITPRQHILLLRVGRRVLVVGDSGSQMNSLTEITDAEEVASLMSQLQDEKSSMPTKAFAAMFGRARNDMGGEDEEMMRGSAGTDDDAAEEADDDPPVDPAISETREEISGLMDKVRVLSKHFRAG